MMFKVLKREVHVVEVLVDAVTKDDAIDLVAQGSGEYLDDTTEYSHDSDRESWEVLQVDAP